MNKYSDVYGLNIWFYNSHNRYAGWVKSMFTVMSMGKFIFTLLIYCIFFIQTTVNQLLPHPIL